MEWTPEQIQFLIDNYKTMKYREIGEIIGKTHNAVATKACKMGIGPGRGKRQVKKAKPVPQPKPRPAKPKRVIPWHIREELNRGEAMC